MTQSLEGLDRQIRILQEKILQLSRLVNKPVTQMSNSNELNTMSREDIANYNNKNTFKFFISKEEGDFKILLQGMTRKCIFNFDSNRIR